MSKRMITGIMLTLLLIGMCGFVRDAQSVKLDLKTVYADDGNILSPWNGTLQHSCQNMTNGIECISTNDLDSMNNRTYYYEEHSMRIIEHRITILEWKELKQKVGVWEEGRNYNQIIDGYGTGLRPPTQQGWAKILEEAYVVDKILWRGQMTELPSSVDYTNSTWFPPIGNQDGEGSCVAWAVGYYMKTFQEAKEHGWDLSGADWEGGYKGHPTQAYQDRIFSPDFIYHQINGGEDSGSFYSDAINLVCFIGACSWEKMPYDPDDYTSWPSESAWAEAPIYRGNSSGYEIMSIYTDDGIASLKNWIASDHLAVISIDSDQYSGLTSNDIWTLDNYAGGGGHANTIVGYDDNIEYTEEGETRHGAFKIANSWGIGGWENINDGCYWISYEAMKERVGLCYFYRDRIGYEPKLVVSFKISHSKRAECDITVGIGHKNSPIQTKRFNDYVDGGDHPFCSNNILFDITEFKDVMPNAYNQEFFLDVYDGGSSTTGTIDKFAIEYAQSTDTPLYTVDNWHVHAYVTLLPLGKSETLVSSDEDFRDNKVSMATDSNGYLYIAYEDWYPAGGRYQIFVQRSTDGGNTWSNFFCFYWVSYDCHNPAIAIDPYDNRVYVAYERVYPGSDHDIWCCVYNLGNGQNHVGVDIDDDNDRYPSITSEYQFGVSNWQYISYEYVHNYDDRDLMFAWSEDHGENWSTKKLHGESWPIPDLNVHTQTSITNAEGYIYIAYKWGADYGSTCEIRVDRSTDFGDSWTQYKDIDGLSNDCCFPSVAATHGGSTVLVAFQYAWSETNDDIWYSYSTDKGENWNEGYGLFISLENERKPAVAVDGEGMTGNNVEGYFHAVCQFSNYIEYRKAHFSNPSNWTGSEIVSERWVGEGLAVTTRFRDLDEQFYPCVAWTDERTKDIYYSIVRAHDIAVTNVTPSKTMVGQSYSLSINVTIENQGDATETFNVTAYANTTIIATLTNITLTSGNSTTITFTWNTTGVPYGNYAITATATPVPSETDTKDNTRLCRVVVTGIGDVNGDFKVNVLDVILILINPGPSPPEPPECDVNCDGTVNVLDVILCFINAGPCK